MHEVIKKKVKTMGTFKLPVAAYTEEWLDCVQNNLISVLMTKDVEFRNLPSLVARRYGVYLPNKSNLYISEEVKTQVYEDGDHILQVKNIDTFSHLLDKRDIPIQDPQEIVDVVKHHLQQGYYLFAYVDRYYYPTGSDAKKNHLLHPTFIYGYDTSKDVLYLLEDCIHTGHIEHYELPFNDFKKAYAEAKMMHISVMKIRDDINVSWDSFFSKTLIRSNVELLLREQRNLQDVIWKNQKHLIQERGMLLNYGLFTINQASEMLGSVLPQMTNRRLERLRVDMRMPYFFRKSTVRLPRLLQEQMETHSAQLEALESQYAALSKGWEKVTNKILLYIEKRAIRAQVPQGYVANISSLLSELYELEQSTANLTLEIL